MLDDGDGDVDDEIDDDDGGIVFVQITLTELNKLLHCTR